jgi:hypothetical protein
MYLNPRLHEASHIHGFSLPPSLPPSESALLMSDMQPVNCWPPRTVHPTSSGPALQGLVCLAAGHQDISLPSSFLFVRGHRTRMRRDQTTQRPATGTHTDSSGQKVATITVHRPTPALGSSRQASRQSPVGLDCHLESLIRLDFCAKTRRPVALRSARDPPKSSPSPPASPLPFPGPAMITGGRPGHGDVLRPSLADSRSVDRESPRKPPAFPSW